MKFTKSSQIINGLSSALQLWLDETLAVLVLYKMPLHKSVTYTSLSESLKKNNSSLDWFVYDNSPTPSQPTSQDSKIILRIDNSNPGVSKAYNEGFKMARSLGKKRMLLLDQDTHFPDDAIEKYHQAMVAYPQENCFVPQLVDRLGPISPFKFRLGNGFRLNSVSKGIQSIFKLQFINSGMLIHLDAFEKAHGFNEKLRLDFSDLAFIGRLKRNLSRFVVVDLIGKHALSGSDNKRSIQEDVERFRMYNASAIEFKSSEMPSMNLAFCIIPHALKLSVKHGNLIFLRVALQSIFKNNAH